MKKYVRPLLFGLLAVLVLLQFYRPARNVSNDQSQHLSTVLPLPDSINQLMSAACYDCHSNLTRYPWYAEVQPVRLWLDLHVNEGNQHLNFSTFAKRRAAVRYHKLEEIVEMVDEKEMPLSSYTWTHADARLSDAQRKSIVKWAQTCMDTMKAQYPADSLVLRRKG